MDLETMAMVGKYLLGATGGLVSYIAANYIIGTIHQNIIGAFKMLNNFGFLIKMLFFPIFQ